MVDGRLTDSGFKSFKVSKASLVSELYWGLFIGYGVRFPAGWRSLARYPAHLGVYIALPVLAYLQHPTHGHLRSSDL